MSLTMQQLLADAKALTTRLGEDDSKLNGLVSDAQTVYSTIESMREYHEDVEELNDEAHQRPRAQLVAGIQQENRHIRELQHENRELKAALEEQQNALDVIMSKYRQQVLKLVQDKKTSQRIQAPSQDYSKISSPQVVDKCYHKMNEMMIVMKKAVSLDDAAYPKQQELIARLMTENKTLRELLEISEKNGTLPPGSRKRALWKEKQTQTDSSDAVPPVADFETSEPCPACGHGLAADMAPVRVSSPNAQPEPLEVSVMSCDTDNSLDFSSDTSVDSVIMSPKRAVAKSDAATSPLSGADEDAPSSIPAVFLT